MIRRILLAPLIAISALACTACNSSSGQHPGGSDLGACSNGLRPSARKDFDAVLAPATKQILVYAGDVAPFDPTGAPNRQYVDELWELDLGCGGWQRLATQTAAGPRGEYAAALDSKRNRMIVYAGQLGTSATPPLVGDVWAFDLATQAWAQLHPSGPAAGSRVGHRMVYDAAADRMIVFGGDGSATFGGAIKGDAFELSFAASTDGTWKQLNASGVAGAPSPRRDVAMAIDSKRKIAVIFGGAFDFQTYTNEVWALDLTTNLWHKLTTLGDIPTHQFRAKMDYDQPRDRLVIFGGHDDQALGLQNATTSLTLDATAMTATFKVIIAGDSGLGVGHVDATSPEAVQARLHPDG
jgi:hypothetical protein